VYGLWYRTPQLKIILKFYQISEYKCFTGAYPLHNFYEICIVCRIFQCFSIDYVSMPSLALDGKEGWVQEPKIAVFHPCKVTQQTDSYEIWHLIWVYCLLPNLAPISKGMWKFDWNYDILAFLPHKRHSTPVQTKLKHASINHWPTITCQIWPIWEREFVHAACCLTIYSEWSKYQHDYCVCQVNGVKLADILFSLLSVCLLALIYRCKYLENNLR